MQAFHPRYNLERNRLELTLRLISVEARTRTIRECTGLSDDRIRKIYSRYFRDGPAQGVRRRRGKSPCRVARFTSNAGAQDEATTLFYLFCATGLMRISATGHAVACWQAPDIEYGQRLCRAYDGYAVIVVDPQYSFEWAWALLRALSQGELMSLGRCRECRLYYVQDRYAIALNRCPGCEIRKNRQRRPGTGDFL